jgi:hypothetical protein
MEVGKEFYDIWREGICRKIWGERKMRGINGMRVEKVLV